MRLHVSCCGPASKAARMREYFIRYLPFWHSQSHCTVRFCYILHTCRCTNCDYWKIVNTKQTNHLFNFQDWNNWSLEQIIMAVIRRISPKTLTDILLLHPQPRISSCVFAVNKQNFSKGSFDYKGKTSYFYFCQICDKNYRLKTQWLIRVTLPLKQVEPTAFVIITLLVYIDFTSNTIDCFVIILPSSCTLHSNDFQRLF